MTKQTQNLEPTNIERAEWARNALAVFTSETYSGGHPETMDVEDLECAIGDLIADRLHFARFHPRLNAVAIHSHALSMFEMETAEEEVGNRSADPSTGLLEALLNIKRLAGKSGDDEADPFALLDLISHQVQSALADVTPK